MGNFGYCLNTSTIKGQELSLPEEIELAARAGYDGIEPWIREMDECTQSGGSLRDLGKKCEDLGLKVVNLIGFFEWCVDDAETRRKGLEEAKRNFEMAAEMGAKMLAAPPFGAHSEGELDLLAAAERYGDLIEMGRDFGVVPVVEFWGVSKNLSRLGEALMVTVESGKPEARLLADVFHMWKGGSSFEGLRHVRGETLGLLHVNDYTGEKPREEQKDSDRVYPGDGVAPYR
ncbi:MAG: sugar phosphate isomerase/epimerase family protein, partial [Candidatus Sumerlaeota bacterium]